MKNLIFDEGHTPIRSVQKQFEAWRSDRTNKREPIPQYLWQAAVGLCREYSISYVCRQLRLSYTGLKKQIPGTQHSAVQFMHIDPDLLSGEWQIECSRADGSCLRMSGNGQAPAIKTALDSFLS